MIFNTLKIYLASVFLLISGISWAMEREEEISSRKTREAHSARILTTTLKEGQIPERTSFYSEMEKAGIPALERENQPGQITQRKPKTRTLQHNPAYTSAVLPSLSPAGQAAARAAVLEQEGEIIGSYAAEKLELSPAYKAHLRGTQYVPTILKSRSPATPVREETHYTRNIIRQPRPEPALLSPATVRASLAPEAQSLSFPAHAPVLELDDQGIHIQITFNNWKNYTGSDLTIEEAPLWNKNKTLSRGKTIGILTSNGLRSIKEEILHFETGLDNSYYQSLQAYNEKNPNESLILTNIYNPSSQILAILLYLREKKRTDYLVASKEISLTDEPKANIELNIAKNLMRSELEITRPSSLTPSTKTKGKLKKKIFPFQTK